MRARFVKMVVVAGSKSYTSQSNLAMTFFGRFVMLSCFDDAVRTLLKEEGFAREVTHVSGTQAIKTDPTDDPGIQHTGLMVITN